MFVFLTVGLAQNPPGMEEAVCRDKKHFVECFGWNHETCLALAKKAVKRCQKIMPPSPKPGALTEEAIKKSFKNRDGAGFWGITIGHCAEVTLYLMAKDKITDPACHTYFENRSSTLDNNNFEITLAKVKKELTKPPIKPSFWNTTKKTTLVMLIVGLLPFWVIGGFIWKMWRLSYSVVAMILLIPSFVLSCVTPIKIGLFSQAVREFGDNPTAMAPLFTGYLYLFPLYFLSMWLIYRWVAKPLKSVEKIRESNS